MKISGKKGTARHRGPRLVTLTVTSFSRVCVPHCKSDTVWKVKGRNIFYYINQIIHKLVFQSTLSRGSKQNHFCWFQPQKLSTIGLVSESSIKTINACPTLERRHYATFYSRVSSIQYSVPTPAFQKSPQPTQVQALGAPSPPGSDPGSGTPKPGSIL